MLSMCLACIHAWNQRRALGKGWILVGQACLQMHSIQELGLSNKIHYEVSLTTVGTHDPWPRVACTFKPSTVFPHLYIYLWASVTLAREYILRQVMRSRMSLKRPRRLNEAFEMKQCGHGQEPMSLIVAIKTLKLLRTGMGSNNLDSKESLRGWVWSNNTTTMKSACEVNS
jgi:hypothetical protein